MSKNDHDKGYDAGKTGKESNPPGNSDWAGIISDQIFGNDKTNEYLKGYKEGQKDRENK
jgi:hypothetical protein